MAKDFVTWLESELRARDWSQADLARKSGLTPPAISKVLSRERMPGPEMCKKLAKAFGLSEIKVFEMAGITSDSGAKKFSPMVEAAAAMLNDLSEEDQEELRAMIRVKWERMQRKKHAGGAKA